MVINHPFGMSHEEVQRAWPNPEFTLGGPPPPVGARVRWDSKVTSAGYGTFVQVFHQEGPTSAVEGWYLIEEDEVSDQPQPSALRRRLLFPNSVTRVR